MHYHDSINMEKYLNSFLQAKHDISLRFRGSSNQRLLDMPRTLAAGQPVWWEDEKVFATHTMEGN